MAKILLTTLMMTLAWMSCYSQPRLEIVDDYFNFGYTPQNSTLVYRFWFKSVGTDTVVINDIKTGCSCAVMPLEKDRIAPGDSMRVGFFWDIKKNLGPTGRTVRVFTNAAQDPLRLHLDAEVQLSLDSARPVSVKPFRCELAKSSRAVIDSMSFTLTNHTNQDLSVALVSPFPDECELVLPDSIKALSSDNGYVKVKPEFADIEFETSMTLLFSDQQANRLTVPIRRKFYFADTKGQ
jgi:hypothetical protein